MILADKIIMLRKKSGWSQEALAEKLNVSRQSVSKWEGAQSIPELDKIIVLSMLFGVSTDFLLRDEQEVEEYTEGDGDIEPSVRRVSIEEANQFLDVKEATGKQIAFATFLCILSPICLFLLGAAAEAGLMRISENVVGAIGLIALIGIIIPAVAIFIFAGRKTEPFQFLENEVIETAYGVSGMVRERKNSYRDTYTKYNVLGTCLCIASVIPLFTFMAFPEDGISVFYGALAVSLTLLLVAIGVVFFIVGNINWASMQKLLEEGDYTRKKKTQSHGLGAIAGVYWLVVIAGYLAHGLYTNDWGNNWIVWPVAGVLFAALMVACEYMMGRKNQSK